MRTSASLPGSRLLAAAGGSELLVMHNLAAMADTERAAFFAARSQGADVSVQGLGRERPSIFARRLRPRALTRGSLTPQLSICQCRRRLSRVHRPSSAPPACHLGVSTDCSCPPGSESLHRPADREHLSGSGGSPAAITQPSFELCSAPCKARRFAPPTRVSARGLRALTAPARSSPDCNCVMATPCVSSRSQATPVSGNRSQMRS